MVQHPHRVWYSQAAAAQAAKSLALACMQGARVVGEGGGVALTVQLLHGAAVRDPAVRGWLSGYACIDSTSYCSRT